MGIVRQRLHHILALRRQCLSFLILGLHILLNVLLHVGLIGSCGWFVLRLVILRGLDGSCCHTIHFLLLGLSLVFLLFSHLVEEELAWALLLVDNRLWFDVEVLFIVSLGCAFLWRGFLVMLALGL